MSEVPEQSWYHQKVEGVVDTLNTTFEGLSGKTGVIVKGTRIMLFTAGAIVVLAASLGEVVISKIPGIRKPELRI